VIDMPASVSTVWNWKEALRWVIMLAVVVMLVGWLYLLKRKDTPDAPESTVKPVKTLVATVTEKVSAAVTDAKVERAVIKTKSDMKRKELEEIRKEPDGKKRREKLASILQKSL